MFNFTTTTIVNSTDGLFKGDFAKGLYVNRVGSFNAEEVIKMYKKAYVPEDFAVNTVTAPAGTAGDIYRLLIDIELYKSDSSIYARPWPTKGKPVVVEAIVPTTGTLAEVLASNASKYMNLVYDTEILTVEASGNTITITAKEGTQVLKNVAIEKWVPDAPTANATYAGGKWELAATGNLSEEHPGNPGFGTYQHLIQNVVLPTYENIRYGSPAPNVPKIDGHYSQYVVTKRSLRDPYGTGAVGQELVSVTEHVFWVESAAITDFENAFAGKFGDNDVENDVYETVSVLDE